MKYGIRLKVRQIMLEALLTFCELKKIFDPAQMRSHPQFVFYLNIRQDWSIKNIQLVMFSQRYKTAMTVLMSVSMWKDGWL